MVVIFFSTIINATANYIFRDCSAELLCIQEIDDYTIIVGGQNGRLIRSDDGGNHFRWLETGFRGSFYEIEFLNKDFGYVVGDSGVIYRTTDGGNNWSRYQNKDSMFKSIEVLDDKTAIVAGTSGKILKTTNGGDSWHLIPNVPSVDYYAIKFINNKDGFACGSKGLIIQTTDGGDSWFVNAEFDSIFILRSMDFLGSEGVITGYNHYLQAGNKKCIVLLTNDTGKSWKSIDSIRNHLLDPFLGCIIPKINNFIFHGRGLLYKTTDFGLTWEVDTLNPKQILKFYRAWLYKRIHAFQISRSKNNKIWIVGTENSILRSDDTGKTFKLLNYAKFQPYIPEAGRAGVEIRGIKKVNPTDYIAYGQRGMVLLSTDKGVLWKWVFPIDTIDRVVFETTDSYLYDAHFFNEKEGIIVGQSKLQRDQTLVIRTNDGGRTWKRIPNSIRGASLSFLDEKIGYALIIETISYVENKFLAKTTDGGYSWSKIQLSQDSGIDNRQIKFFDENNGYLLSYRYVPLYDSLGNKTGIRRFTMLYKIIIDSNELQLIYKEEHPNNRYWDNFVFTDKNNGWLYGSSDVYLRTTDGGKSWIEYNIDGVRRRLGKPIQVDDNFFIGSTSNDTVFITYNGGKDWETITLEYNKQLSYMFDVTSESIITEGKNIMMSGYGNIVQGIWIDEETNVEQYKVEKSESPYFYIKITPHPVKNTAKIKLYGLFNS
ncbi:MAG: YCF48-related protein, partial [Candidatus Kapabacteria bacterium]|nr:YCF48-related protein [Candidatus Kapabacteria bacterium]